MVDTAFGWGMVVVVVVDAGVDVGFDVGRSNEYLEP